VTDLDDPWPDVLGRGGDRHYARRDEHGSIDDPVARHGAVDLDVRRAPVDLKRPIDEEIGADGDAQRDGNA
jgi:hypothetical protein